MSIYFLFIFVIMAFFFFIIGFGVMLRKKPLLINSRYFFAFMVLAFSPRIVSMISEMIGETSINFRLLDHLITIMIIFFLGYYWIQMKGYMVVGVSDGSFRSALRSSLKKNSLDFEEQLSIIRLTELGVDIQVSLQSWVGVGQIKCKKSKDSYLLPRIINGINEYYRENSVTPNNITSVFYIIMGVFTLAMSGVFYSMFGWSNSL